MSSGEFLARFYFPGADSVLVESQVGAWALQSDDGAIWSREIAVVPDDEPLLYRFCVDDALFLPDPFNEEFCLVDGRYYSLWSPQTPFQQEFPEWAEQLYLTNEIPSHANGYGPTPIGRFGPRDPLVAAVAEVGGLVRPDNHALWVWKAPGGRRWGFDRPIPRGATHSFSYIPYGLIPDFGEWTVSFYLNGRWRGDLTGEIRSLGYPPSLIRRPSAPALTSQGGFARVLS